MVVVAAVVATVVAVVAVVVAVAVVVNLSICVFLRRVPFPTNSFGGRFGN